MRFLIWLVIGFVVVTWVMRAKSGLSTADRESRENKQGRAEAMLQCANCGMHVPASEASIDAAGLAFCSEEHLALHHVR
jgi:uncharacterized protein